MIKEENLYDLTRAFYAYVSKKYNKQNCTVVVVQGENTDEIKQRIIDALLFDGCQILDCGLKKNEEIEFDGLIDIEESDIHFFDKDGNMNEKIRNVKDFVHYGNAKCTKVKGEEHETSIESFFAS